MRSGSEQDDYDQPRGDWIRSLLNKIVYLLVFVAAFILLICWFLPLVKEQQRQQHALQALKQQVEQEKSKLQQTNQKAHSIAKRSSLYRAVGTG